MKSNIHLSQWDLLRHRDEVDLYLLFFRNVLLQTSFQRLLKKQGGKRAAWEYPFAVAGVNITFMNMQMLDLDACMYNYERVKISFIIGITNSIIKLCL